MKETEKMSWQWRLVFRSNLITIIITVIVLLKERHQIGPGYIERASNLTDRRPHVSSPTKTRAKLQTWCWISSSSLALSLSLIVIEKSRHVWCIAACFIFCHLQLQLPTSSNLSIMMLIAIIIFIMMPIMMIMLASEPRCIAPNLPELQTF